MLLRIAGIIEESIVDGPGLRFVVFVQGCKRHCPGCHNPQTHDYNSGLAIEPKEIIEMMKKNPLLDGLSLSGGEPFDQPEALTDLAESAHRCGYGVMAWSGYTFEELMANEAQRRLLEAVDVLVDGPFMLEQRSLSLLWRGSANQRVLDVKRSLAENSPVEIEEECLNNS
ncbi:anaerobic ribonucleoside-triphosphate reductase activating protein [bacterium]|nr:anaerobic ribonucleoside-triphosphate reductase activating protein [bacterium]